MRATLAAAIAAWQAIQESEVELSTFPLMSLLPGRTSVPQRHAPGVGIARGHDSARSVADDSAGAHQHCAVELIAGGHGFSPHACGLGDEVLRIRGRRPPCWPQRQDDGAAHNSQQRRATPGRGRTVRKGMGSTGREA